MAPIGYEMYLALMRCSTPTHPNKTNRELIRAALAFHYFADAIGVDVQKELPSDLRTDVSTKVEALKACYCKGGTSARDLSLNFLLYRLSMIFKDSRGRTSLKTIRAYLNGSDGLLPAWVKGRVRTDVADLERTFCSQDVSHELETRIRDSLRKRIKSWSASVSRVPELSEKVIEFQTK